MVVFYTVLMTLNVACAFLILMSGIRQQKQYLLSLACLNILGLGLNYFAIKLHTSQTLAQAMLASDLHTIIVILCLPLMIFTFGNWCKYKHTNVLSLLFLFFGMLLLTVSYITGYSLRYGDVAKLIHFKTLFGDEIAIIKGESNNVIIFIPLLYMVSSCLLILFASRLFTQQKKLLSLFLITFLCLQFFVSFTGYKIDSLEWPLFYIGGLPLSIFSVFCTALISSFYKIKSEELVSQLEEQKKLEQTITKLAHGLSSIDSKSVYLELSKMIYDLSKADIVLLGLIKQTDTIEIETLAVLKSGSAVENFSYPLKGTPCDTAITDNVCMFPKNVAALYPNDKILSDEGIESYIGVPLLNQNNTAVGILCVLYKTPRSENLQFINALKIFSSRAASEIKRDELEQNLKSMAYYDYQSRLPNRAKLLDVINETYFQCKKSHTNALFILIDLDNFGDINRKYGHEVGDQVIRLLGLRLQHYSSTDIFIARNAGDEFAIILSKMSGEITSFLNVHWQAISAIINETCIVGERKIKMKCSMGAVVFPQQIGNRFDVISSAEHSVERAKENGRNHCVLFDPQLLAQIDYKKQIELDLAKAIKNNKHLSIVYQAKVTQHGDIIGSEALLRWTHPEKGFISPTEFIPIAEESGLIHNLGKWVINEVCRQMREWIDSGLTVHKVSINVAASQFDDPNFISYVFSVLNNYQINAKYIEIELTETGLLIDIDKAIENICRLREYGITIALDDFGTGFSSLSYLQDLPLDVLKIDKSFIDNINQTKSADLIKSIIDICGHMNYKTVAEGTESLDQVEALVAMGCDYFQGYYFSRPLPAKEFIVFCNK